MSATPSIDRIALEGWKALCANPAFNDLPFKVEMNRGGQILMSPTQRDHSFLAGRITSLLLKQRPEGEYFAELAVLVEGQIRVPSSCWASPERAAKINCERTATTAPEVCVEVFSPSNTPSEIEEKRLHYFKAGTLEFWTCSREGRIRLFLPEGESDRSTLFPDFPAQIQHS